MDKVEQKFLKAVKDFRLLEGVKSLVVGLSGGADSVCLLFLLNKYRTYLGLEKIIAVHVNHKIRETAERDEKFCLELCKSWNIPLEVKKVDVPKLAKERKKSLEDVAREVRYSLFREVKKLYNAAAIATAHHLDDLLETQLLFLVRGSGTEGLKGFSPKEGDVIRPLFYLTKEEIKSYLHRKGINYVEDETNYDITIPRNFLRHKVIPLLKELNPSLPKVALRLFDILNEENRFWKKHIEELKKELLEGDAIKLDRFKKLTVAQQRRFLKEIFPSWSFSNLEKLRKFALKDKTYLLLDGKFELLKREGLLIVRPFEGRVDYLYLLKVPGEVYIKELNEVVKARWKKLHSWEELKTKPKNVEYFQFEEPPKELIVRNRREGDRFVPFGRSKPVKLKDFFIKEKVPKPLRDKVPLITLANKILWIAGVRRSNFFTVKDLNKEVLEVVYEQLC